MPGIEFKHYRPKQYKANKLISSENLSSHHRIAKLSPDILNSAFNLQHTLLISWWKGGKSIEEITLSFRKRGMLPLGQQQIQVTLTMHSINGYIE